ncbi:MAG: hypothetical protein SPE78_10300, partial [Actinobacillus minor]|nr:hypothetical protein [Actinobacillus minor]
MDNAIYTYSAIDRADNIVFKLSIYSHHISSRQLRYAQTLQKRGEEIPACYVQINGEKQPLEHPIFFENSRYDIE